MHNVSLQIQVAVPRLSQPVASWLLKTPEKLASPKQTVMCGPLVNSWCNDVNDSSTQQWLIDIQNHPEVEEENEFEITSRRTSSGKTLRLPQVLIVYFRLLSSSVGEFKGISVACPHPTGLISFLKLHIGTPTKRMGNLQMKSIGFMASVQKHFTNSFIVKRQLHSWNVSVYVLD